MCSSKSHISHISACVCSYTFTPVSAGTHSHSGAHARICACVCRHGYRRVFLCVHARMETTDQLQLSCPRRHPPVCFEPLAGLCSPHSQAVWPGSPRDPPVSTPTALGLHEGIAIPSFHIIIISVCMCGRRMCTACV